MILTQIIPVIGIVQGIFLGIILFSLESGNKKANATLGILIICISLSISKPIFSEFNQFFVLLIYLFGPLLLFYVLQVTKSGYVLKIRLLFHLIPFLIAVFTRIIYINIDNDILYKFVIVPLGFLKILHTIIYCLFIFHYIGKYRSTLKDHYSKLEEINLSWISMLLYLFILYFLVITPVIWVILILDIKWLAASESVWTPIIISIYIFFIGFNGVRHHQVFLEKPISSKEKKPGDFDADIRRLINFMEIEKPFLLNDLTLTILSELSDIPEYHISRLINEKLNKNFFDFVNNYRINYYNKICCLEENHAKSVLGLALESGFYSKSTFNLNYKKEMGITPSQYRKREIVKKEKNTDLVV